MSGIVNQPALADLPRVTRRAGTEGFLSNLVEDLTPQLGGRLDPNGQAVGWDRGADLTSASPLVIGTDGNYFVVTGATGFSVMTVAANSFFGLQFSGALTMTDGASLDLGGANITTATGDRGLFFATAANTVKLVAPFLREGFSLPPPDFTSSEQVVDFDIDLDVAHGLSTIPTLVEVVLRCKTGEHGYVTDDELPGGAGGWNPGTADAGATIFKDTTNVTIRQGVGIRVHDASFNNVVVTEANWKWVVRAWK